MAPRGFDGLIGAACFMPDAGVNGYRKDRKGNLPVEKQPVGLLFSALAVLWEYGKVA
jgi:hypothetical protein